MTDKATALSFLRDHLCAFINKLPIDDYNTLRAWHHRAADLIEQQAERIKELEAELERERIRLASCGSAALGYFEGCKDEYYSASLDDVLRLREQLTALRQRIADAPVVAWMGEYNINDIRDHYTVVMRHKTDFDGMPERVRALVFKETLQK